MKSFKSRIIGAGAWTLFQHVTSQLIRLGSNLIITRLLIPEMFGVMAIANTLLTGIQLFSHIGLRQNIIQSHRGDNIDFLNTAWTVQIIRGVIVWSIGLAAAVLIYTMNELKFWQPDAAYSEAVLPYIIAVISFSAVIDGFQSTKLATENRNLSFRLITRIELLAQVTGVTLMIALAMQYVSIWCLTAGPLGSSLVKVVLSHRVLPGNTNKLHWDYEIFKDLLNFGKWMLMSTMFGFLAASGDRLLLAGWIDSRLLGIYFIALFMVQAISQVLIKLSGTVGLPVLSEVVRTRPTELMPLYYRLRLPVDILSLFSMGFLYVAGEEIIELLYDDRYLMAGGMLEILCIMLFMERYSLFDQCFIALGKPKLVTTLSFARMLILFSLLPASFTVFGMEGVLWAIAVNRILVLPVILYFKFKYNLFDSMKEFRVLLFLIAGAVSGYLFSVVFKSF